MLCVRVNTSAWTQPTARPPHHLQYSRNLFPTCRVDAPMRHDERTRQVHGCKPRLLSVSKAALAGAVQLCLQCPQHTGACSSPAALLNNGTTVAWKSSASVVSSSVHTSPITPAARAAVSPSTRYRACPTEHSLTKYIQCVK